VGGFAAVKPLRTSPKELEVIKASTYLLALEITGEFIN
jgi:hypothetical protein